MANFLNKDANLSHDTASGLQPQVSLPLLRWARPGRLRDLPGRRCGLWLHWHGNSQGQETQDSYGGGGLHSSVIHFFDAKIPLEGTMTMFRMKEMGFSREVPNSVGTR